MTRQSHDQIAQQPLVTVVVPFWRDPRITLCIAALAAQTLNSAQFEVILVNNDPDDPRDYGPLPDNMRIISEAKPGSYAARNTGLRQARGAIIAFTDSDCIPAKDWIETASRLMRDGTLRLSGAIHILPGPSYFANAHDRAFAFRQERLSRNGGAVTANFVIRRELFDTLGPFDEDLLSGGDIEFNERATAKNLKLKYADELVVVHPARDSVEALLIKQRRVSGGQVQVLRRKGRWPLYRYLVKSLLPPFGALKSILLRSDLAWHEKLTAFFVRYRIKLERALAVFRKKVRA